MPGTCYFRQAMNHLPPLIHDLALIMMVAAITTLLFRILKQPVVLGYIIAGFLVSPNFSLLPTVTDVADIRIWAEIGVIFLLFNLGLEFSFKRLLSIGGAASVTAIIEVGSMLVVGFSIGQILGWQLMDCIFLGGILSISSTTIILRAFDELGLKNRRFANLVFGVLIIEDLVAVVLMVLLSTIAASRQFAGMEMLFSVIKLLFFLLLWFVAGIFFLPTFLRRAQRFMSDEMLLVVSLGLCLLMVMLAAKAGFSPALGAFVMGSILAETTQAERIEHLFKPVKDFFGAVFFVSVGMLIEPRVLADYALPIFVITILFLLFKTLSVTIGALTSGQTLKTSIHAGFSQAQIGEFSFIIATLGVTLGVTSDFLYPIAVAVSAITTFTTTYMIRAAMPVFLFAERVLPVAWRKNIQRYSAGAQSISQASDWTLVIRAFLAHIFLFSLIILGIIFLFGSYVLPWVLAHLLPNAAGKVLTSFVCLLTVSPFLWALATRKFQKAAAANLWGNKRYRGVLIIFDVIRGSLGIVYISLLLLSFFSLKIAMAGLLTLVIMAIVFTRRIHAFYIRLENRFFFNYTDRERQAAIRDRHELAPWDAHIGHFVLPAGSPVIGQALEFLQLREKLGVNIAMIRRGDRYSIPAPSRYEKLYPGDTILVIGTDEQLEAFKKHIEPLTAADLQAAHPADDIVLQKMTVHRQSAVLGHTIRESRIREITNGLIVGIERNGRRMLNPESDTVFQEGDKVWIVGEQRLIQELKRANLLRRS